MMENFKSKSNKSKKSNNFLPNKKLNKIIKYKSREENIDDVCSDLSNLVKDSIKSDCENSLTENKISNEEISKYIIKNSKDQNISKEIIQNLYFDNDLFQLEENNQNSRSLQLLKLLNNEKVLFSDVNTLKNYNKNLFIIKSLKSENQNFFFREEKLKIIDKIKNNLNTKKYYSNILLNIWYNIKELKSNHDSEYKDQKNNLYLKKLKTRYRKDNEENDYLEIFFQKNKFKWNSSIIDMLSEKLLLSKYSIYKWNWDKFNKKPTDVKIDD